MAARGAQQAERVRRIGLLMGTADDREGQARGTGFKHGLQELGWTSGRNIQIDTHFGGADTGFLRGPTGIGQRGHPAFLPSLEDCTLVTWYRSLYAPRTGGAYDSHHRTAGIAGCTRRRSGVAAP